MENLTTPEDLMAQVMNQMIELDPTSDEYESLTARLKTISSVNDAMHKETYDEYLSDAKLELDKQMYELERRKSVSENTIKMIEIGLSVITGIGLTVLQLKANAASQERVMLFEKSGYIIRSKAWNGLTTKLFRTTK